MIRDCFYRFGGTVRVIFGSEEMLSMAEEEQEEAASDLTSETASRIVTNCARLDAANPAAPPASIVGICSANGYKTKATEVVWEYLGVILASQAMTDMWLKFLRCFCSLYKPSSSASVLARNRRKVARWKLSRPFGGCSSLQVVNDIATSAASRDVGRDETKLFHSRQSNHELLDCMYYNEKVFYAFKATTLRRYPPPCQLCLKASTVQKLQLELGEKLHLFYAVPEDDFDGFVTDPVDPLAPSEI